LLKKNNLQYDNCVSLVIDADLTDMVDNNIEDVSEVDESMAEAPGTSHDDPAGSTGKGDELMAQSGSKPGGSHKRYRVYLSRKKVSRSNRKVTRKTQRK
jgi:hypothetical protein